MLCRLVCAKPLSEQMMTFCQSGSEDVHISMKFYLKLKNVNYTPRFNEVDRGVYWYHLVRLSVCPSVDRIVSALYLQQYSSDPFHICTSYQAT